MVDALPRGTSKIARTDAPRCPVAAGPSAGLLPPVQLPQPRKFASESSMVARLLGYPT